MTDHAVPKDSLSDDDGWEQHRREALTRWLDATPAQRLAWLEEAIALAYRTGAFPRPETRRAPQGPAQGFRSGR